MVFPILGSGAPAAAYNIDNSGCFGGTGTFLTRSQSSSEDSTARRKFTISCWTKQTLQGSAAGWNGLWGAMVDSNNYTSLKINADKKLIFDQKVSGSNVAFTSDMIFRDPAAWYHIVVAYDSTDGTNANRVKVYVNGSLITGTYGSFVQNEASWWGDNTAAGRVGAYGNNTGDAYNMNGYLADVCCTIGYAESPGAFGEIDSASGIWKPKKPTVFYSANGFFSEFKQTGTSANSSGIGADTSGNDNHFAIDSDDISLFQTTDTPTNNFCTMNPLDNYWAATTLAEGNLKVTMPSTEGYYSYLRGTMAVASGKWYWEVRAVSTTNSSSDYGCVGFAHSPPTSRTDALGRNLHPSGSNGYGHYGHGGGYQYAGNHISIQDAPQNGYRENTWLQFALDLDNNVIWWGLNGTWQDSGDPTSGATATGGDTVVAAALTAGGFYSPAIGDFDSGGTYVFAANFGAASPFAIVSGNADDNGYGNFEYDVPTGFYALCSKNLAEFGG